MPVVKDTHPSNSVLVVGSIFQAVALPNNSRTPTSYTITNSAAVVALNATTMNVTSSATVKLYAGAELKFGSTVVTVATTTTVATTSTALPILPAPATVAANATTTTLGFASLLGIQDMTEDSKASLISIRSLASGKYNDQRVTMLDNSLQFSGWYNQQDLAMTDIIKPAYRNASELYFQAQYTDGETVYGVGIISSLTRSAKLDDVQKYTFTLNVNGTPGYGSVTTPLY